MHRTGHSAHSFTSGHQVGLNKIKAYYCSYCFSNAKGLLRFEANLLLIQQGVYL